VIFAGHVHDYRDVMLDKTRVVISGCGGGSLRAPSTETHWLEISLSNGEIHIKRMPFEGQSRVSAAIAYSFCVQVPRYRWRFFGATVLLLIIALRRLANRAETRPEMHENNSGEEIA
jgi:uncharacterized membrane protein